MKYVPMSEHPTPQWERENWQNLNGVWEFDYDFGVSARERKLYEKNEKLSYEILVPFCPESKLSGLNFTDFMNCVCYKREFYISNDNIENNTIIHFGAVDYHSYIYINGKFAFEHIGGFSSFSADITKLVNQGNNTVFVIAEDNTKNGNQPQGKQSRNYYSEGCFYTRTTGIWQTVWLEFVPKSYIKNAKFYPDTENSSITIMGETVGKGKLKIRTSYKGKTTGECEINATGSFTAFIKLNKTHLWTVGKGELYDIEFTFDKDSVKSYFGLRDIRLDEKKFLINSKSVFQRLVLDQGFYPEGIYTAPSEEDLVKDIELSIACGFNGARLHQKVFEPRFLYHCDRLGYIVWGEHGNWGLDYHDKQATEIYMNEWLEIIERDFNHPSIIGWCPLNETWGYIESKSKNRLLSSIYKLTKALDSTRPVIDTSGNYHCITDIYDTHDYEQNCKLFKEHYDEFENSGKLFDHLSNNGEDQLYDGEKPVFISEYGGIKWSNEDDDSWGYGESPKTENEFFERYKSLTTTLLSNPQIMGFCYTQLYDIEQEKNGLYTYSREPKFDVNIFKEINSQKAKIED